MHPFVMAVLVSSSGNKIEKLEKLFCLLNFLVEVEWLKKNTATINKGQIPHETVVLLVYKVVWFKTIQGFETIQLL